MIRAALFVIAVASTYTAGCFVVQAIIEQDWSVSGIDRAFLPLAFLVGGWLGLAILRRRA